MNKKDILIIIIVGLVLSGLYFILNTFTRKNSNEYDEYLKDYKVNEYISVYVSDEDMAKIYFNDYIHTMYYDVESAYNLLDKEYRESKFGNLNNYIDYVRSLNYSLHNIQSYYKVDAGTYIIFGVYDEGGNKYIFKSNGVMQYSVYLDEETVEIW